MQGLLLALVLVGAVASRPIVIRVWRAGRLSDRSAAVLGVGRFPVLALVFGLILGLPPLLIAALTAIGVLSAVLFYRFALEVIREQSSRRVV
jgi:hypothetical protein